MAFYALAENQPPIFGLTREAVLQPNYRKKDKGDKGTASLGYTVWSGDAKSKFGGAHVKKHPVLDVESLPRNWWITPGRMKRLKNKRKAREVNREVVPEIKAMYRKWAKINWTTRAQKIETIERVLEQAKALGPKKGLQKGDRKIVLKKLKAMKAAQAEKEWYASRKEERARSRAEWKKKKQEIAEEKRLKREERSQKSDNRSAWEQELRKLSQGLDLNDPNDREDLAERIERATKTLKVATIKDLAKHFGAEKTGRSRASVTKALTDAWIKMHKPVAVPAAPEATEPEPAPEPAVVPEPEPEIVEEVVVEDPDDPRGFKKDLSKEFVTSAYRGLTFNSERTAGFVIDGYKSHLESVLNAFKRSAGDDPSKQELAEELFEKYREGYRKRYMSVLSTRSGMVSQFVAGRGGWSRMKRKQDKLQESERNKLRELDEWSEKAFNRSLNKISPRHISRDSDTAIEDLEAKISSLEKQRDLTKEMNKIVRSKKMTDDQKIEKLIEAFPKLTPGQARNVLHPRYGKPGFNVSSITRDIRYAKGRIKELKELQSIVTQETRFDDLNLSIFEDNDSEKKRLQILFDSKPDADLIKTLRKNGFKWSPRNKAWQRMLNDNAYFSLERVLGITRDQLTGEEEEPLAPEAPAIGEAMEAVELEAPAEEAAAEPQSSAEMEEVTIDTGDDTMTFEEARKGDILKVKNIPDDFVRFQITEVQPGKITGLDRNGNTRVFFSDGEKIEASVGGTYLPVSGLTLDRVQPKAIKSDKEVELELTEEAIKEAAAKRKKFYEDEKERTKTLRVQAVEKAKKLSAPVNDLYAYSDWEDAFLDNSEKGVKELETLFNSSETAFTDVAEKFTDIMKTGLIPVDIRKYLSGEEVSRGVRGGPVVHETGLTKITKKMRKSMREARETLESLKGSGKKKEERTELSNRLQDEAFMEKTPSAIRQAIVDMMKEQKGDVPEILTEMLNAADEYIEDYSPLEDEDDAEDMTSHLLDRITFFDEDEDLNGSENSLEIFRDKAVPELSESLRSISQMTEALSLILGAAVDQYKEGLAGNDQEKSEFFNLVKDIGSDIATAESFVSNVADVFNIYIEPWENSVIGGYEVAGMKFPNDVFEGNVGVNVSDKLMDLTPEYFPASEGKQPSLF